MQRRVFVGALAFVAIVATATILWALRFATREVPGNEQAATRGTGKETPRATDESAEVRGLLSRECPSSRIDAADPRLEGKSVIFGGFPNDDRTDATIDRLLSARGIPFHIHREGANWNYDELDVVVPKTRRQEVAHLLEAAVKAGVLKRHP